jgi:hypothetical protein
MYVKLFVLPLTVLVIAPIIAFHRHRYKRRENGDERAATGEASGIRLGIYGRCSGEKGRNRRNILAAVLFSFTARVLMESNKAA